MNNQPKNYRWRWKFFRLTVIHSNLVLKLLLPESTSNLSCCLRDLLTIYVVPWIKHRCIQSLAKHLRWRILQKQFSDYELLTIFAKSSILDVSMDSGYSSENAAKIIKTWILASFSLTLCLGLISRKIK